MHASDNKKESSVWRDAVYAGISDAVDQDTTLKRYAKCTATARWSTTQYPAFTGELG